MTHYQILIVCAVPLLQAAAMFFCVMAYARGRFWPYLLFGSVHLFGVITSCKSSIDAFRSNPRPFHGQPIANHATDQNKGPRYVTTPPRFPVGSLASAVGFWALARREAKLANQRSESPE